MELLNKARMNIHDTKFFDSLFSQFKTYNTLSDKQLIYIDKFLKKYHKQIMVNLFA